MNGHYSLTTSCTRYLKGHPADAAHSVRPLRPADLMEHTCAHSAILTWITPGSRPHRSRSAILSRSDGPRTGAWVLLSHSHSLVRPMMEPEPADILPPGFRYEVHKRVTATDVHLWAGLTGEQSPIRSATAFAQQAAAERWVAPGAYLTGLVADTVARLAARVPPPGASIETLRVHFAAPVPVGTTLSVVVTVAAWDATAGFYWLDIHAARGDGTPAVLGWAWLRPHPTLLAAA